MMDGAIREAVRAAFAEMDDSEFWLLSKTVAAGPYGRSSALDVDACVPGTGTVCHVTLVRNLPVKLMEKAGDKETYNLTYEALEDSEIDIAFSATGGNIALRSNGGPLVYYGVIQAPANNPADVGIKTVRRKAVIVRLESQLT